jgi:hypothetical protein
VVESNLVDDADLARNRPTGGPPSGQVNGAQRAVIVNEGKPASVPAEVDGGQAVAVAVQRADRGRASQQRGEQVRSRLWRVVERDALAL